MAIRTIGIDLGKTIFHLVALDENGNIVGKKRCSRTQLLTFWQTHPPASLGWRLVAVLTCSGVFSAIRRTKFT